MLPGPQRRVFVCVLLTPTIIGQWPPRTLANFAGSVDSFGTFDYRDTSTARTRLSQLPNTPTRTSYTAIPILTTFLLCRFRMFLLINFGD
jgi:hypothetical protein